MGINSHRTDWVPGGRQGTHENYREGYEKTFGEQDIFKNLAPENVPVPGTGTKDWSPDEAPDNS